MSKAFKKVFKSVTSILGLGSAEVPKLPAVAAPAVPATPAPAAATSTQANITIGAAAAGDRVSGSSGRYVSQSSGTDPLGGLGLGGLRI